MPKNYKEKQKAIKFVKDEFSKQLENKLNLIEVRAPLLTKASSGMQDNLNGTEKPVEVKIKNMPKDNFEVVQSLAKWKRFILGKYNFQVGEGLYTNMHALRPDEEYLDAAHSVYVDQWDWEKVIDHKDRTLATLKTTVEALYECIKHTHLQVCACYLLPRFLPDKITFIHTEDLAKEYPEKTGREREYEICKKYKAVFLIGIGGEIEDGKAHDGRAPDYDDWTTDTDVGYRGLNGDILVWNPILNSAFEISSMGIRVDREALLRQLKIRNNEERLQFDWHKMLLSGQMLQTIGGGIGQSRLVMLLLQKQHIGEVQCSVWPENFLENQDIL